jgi:anti-anti-sigma regulatory factor
VHVERIARDGDATYLRFGGIVTDDPRNDLDPGLVAPSDYGRGALLSLRDVTLLNSRGIGMLLKLNRAMKDAGGRMVLVDVPTSVQQVLRYMKLDDVLAIAGSEQEAEEMLR